MNVPLVSPYYATGTTDFAALAGAVPAFKPFIRLTHAGHTTINFKDPIALRALSIALLQRDFNLVIDLPQDRLCPMIPGRLEYVHYILQIASITAYRQLPLSLTGLDIGTGASAIYPLLALRTFPAPHSVKFIATDIDPLSSIWAARNIARNGASDKVRLVMSEQGEQTDLFDAKIFWGDDNAIDFSMCNPPFYSDAEEIAELAEFKQLDPHAVCTGSTNEMITLGGEVNFVTRMINESLRLPSRIRWYSSLLGKWSSVTQVIKLLRENQIDNYALKELTTGKTKRWILAWSFTNCRLPDELARPLPLSPRTTPALQAYLRLLPLPNTLVHPIFTPNSAEMVWLRLINELKSLQVPYSLSSSSSDLLDPRGSTQMPSSESTQELIRSGAIIAIKAIRNSWSRSARRRRTNRYTTSSRDSMVDVKDDRMEEEEEEGQQGEPREEMECTISILFNAREEQETDGMQDDKVIGEVNIHFKWSNGRQRILFESLVSHLISSLRAPTSATVP